MRVMAWRMAHVMCVALVGLSGHARAAELTIGSKAPVIDIEHWIQTRGGDLQPVKEFSPGKVYVVEFWATWCGPCVACMPHLAAIQDAFIDKGVTIVSVSDEDVETIEKFLDQKADGEGDKTYRDVTKAYCLTTDPDRSVGKDYMEATGESGIPCAFIVGKTGEIEWIGHPMEMDKPLEKVVGGQWNRSDFAHERKANKAFDEGLRKLRQLVREGEDKQAAELFEALVADANGSIEKLNAAAWTVASMKTDALAARAAAAAKRAIELDPSSGDVLDTLAHLYELQGDLPKAITTQREAVRHAPSAVKKLINLHLKRLQKKAAIGSKAPPIDIEHWVQNRGGAFAPVKEFTPGKVYVIEFWRTSCGSCAEGIGQLSQLQDDHAAKGVTVISVSDEDPDTIEKFLDQKVDSQGDKTFRDLTKAYCLTTDPDRSVFKDYMDAVGEQVIPTAFIVGKTGEIEWLGAPEQMDLPLEKVVSGQWDRSLFDQDFTGRIGAGIAIRGERSMITEIVPDSPAARAGLVPELIIHTIDGKETEGLDLRTVIKMIGGRHGTKVRLDLIDPTTGEPRTVEVVREWPVAAGK